MKPNLEPLLQQRQALLAQMQAIDRLRRGSVSQQFFKSPRRHGPKRGPYFLLQGFFRGKKFSERVPQDQAPQLEQDVAQYRRFQAWPKTTSPSATRSPASEIKATTVKNSSRRRSPMSSSRKPPPS